MVTVGDVYGLTSPQFGALCVLSLEPGLWGTTAQAANLLVAAMERDGLVRRRSHPTHGRILEIFPTDEGVRRFGQAQPFASPAGRRRRGAARG